MSKLHLYRRKASAHWHARVYVGGRRYRFTCKTADKPTAREYARQRAQELRERHNRGLTGLPEPVRVCEAFARYEREYAPRLRPMSRKRALDVVRQARQWFTGGPLRDPLVARVTPNDIQAFLDTKRTEGVSARTVNLYRGVLHRVFRLCVRPWLLISTNPVAATEPLPTESREPRIPDESEYRALVAECTGQPMLALFVTLAWETGARSGELLQVEWRDVDFEKRLITFRNDPDTGRHTKGRRSRTIPLSAAALTALREHAARFRLTAPLSRWVFRHLRRTKDAGPGDRLRSVRRGFTSAARRAGLSGVHPHCLRHALVTRKLAQGVPVQLVSRYVGHADLATTMRYTHLVPEHLRAVVATDDGGAAGSARMRIGL